jgi:acyl-CoA thioesterase
MQGGAMFAAIIIAMERVAARPLVWATAQYLSHVGPGATFDIDVDLEVHGHQMTQARATATTEGTMLTTVLGALGRRSFPAEGTWVAPPRVPSPADCDLVRDVRGAPRNEVWELRRASGRSLQELTPTAGPGRTASWCRLPGGARQVSAGDLAIMGDFLMTHFADALGWPCTGNSLDNTVRVAGLSATEWVLLDAQVQFVGNGLGYGSAHLWSENGVLLGTSSQTLALRELGSDGLSARSNRRIVQP